MNGNWRLAIFFAAGTLLWNLYGFAGNFFEHYWGGFQMLPVTFISYLLNALLLAALALVAVKQPTAVRILAIAGLIMALWSLGGVAIEVGVALGYLVRATNAPPMNLPLPLPLLGPLVPMITAALSAFCAWSSAASSVPKQN